MVYLCYNIDFHLNCIPLVEEIDNVVFIVLFQDNEDNCKIYIKDNLLLLLISMNKQLNSCGYLIYKVG